MGDQDLTPKKLRASLNWPAVRITALTLAVGSVGGLAFYLAGVPAAFLSGSILATAAVALTGVRQDVPPGLRTAGYVAVGIVIGSAIDGETLALLPRWPVSIAALAVAMALVLLVVPWYFNRVHGMDAPTARLAAVPGAMSQVLALADDLDVDARRVVILHGLRLIILMILVPVAVGLGLETGTQRAPEHPPMDLSGMALLVVASGTSVPLMRRMRIPSPAFTGPMGASGLLVVTGVVQGTLPEPVVIAAFVVMGATIGAHFSGVSLAYVLSCLGIGAGGVLIAVAITAGIAWPTAAYLEMPFLQIWLALAPGGFDTMAALALSLGQDPAFVAGHQLVRLLGLYAAIPLLFRTTSRA